MKRLLCILSGMNAGGAETFLMKLYRALDRTKYQMDFCINVKEKCFYEEEILSLGGKIFRIPPKSASVAAFKKNLYEVIQNNHYQYVLRITSSAMGLMDLKIAKKAGAQICAARSSNSSFKSGFATYAAHRIGRWVYMKYVDVKIAPSDLAAEYTFGKKAYKNGDVQILHNAVDMDVFFYREEARKKICEEFGIPSDAGIIGHIGRFDRQKNHAFLIDIFSEIHRRDPNTVLLLVGNGPLEDDIRTKVQALRIDTAVYFIGVRTDIPELLSAMDVFLLPSFYEGMPNAVIEAQATGLPCVISDAITKEANITGLVTYRSIAQPADVWAETALSQIHAERVDTEEIFIEKKYDIQSVVNEFTAMIFSKGGGA